MAEMTRTQTSFQSATVNLNGVRSGPLIAAKGDKQATRVAKIAQCRLVVQQKVQEGLHPDVRLIAKDGKTVVEMSKVNNHKKSDIVLKCIEGVCEVVDQGVVDQLTFGAFSIGDAVKVRSLADTFDLEIDDAPTFCSSRNHVYLEEMNSRLSAKTRIFLDAVYAYYKRQYDKGVLPQEQAWTLYFLGKIIFYPAITEGIDEDSSGYISVHEVNEFVGSKPKGWSVPEWFAFWAVGPYQTDIEYQIKIRNMLFDLEATANYVLPYNARRVQYFCSVIPKLKLIGVYDDMLDISSERRDQEYQYIKVNLQRVRYTLTGDESVPIIVNGQRIEQSLLCLVYILLSRHLKVVKLATKQHIPVDEFMKMRESWEYIFNALDKRISTLVQVWRQQRLDISIHLQSFAGGMFEDWYEQIRYLQRTESASHANGDFAHDTDYEDSLTDGEMEPSGSSHEIPLLLSPIPREPEDDSWLPMEDAEMDQVQSDMESDVKNLNRTQIPESIERKLQIMETSFNERLSVVEDLLRQLLSR
ncbi:hypothetical protein NM688_g482 [Phlebia brevispora]|uniref:Uncharacterized protein n=1 Tax=Phlebia brevispora TaxID=194682 RepID=A0ACC1TEC0_9APHY|nr:hypothetical protein NM688_g482 [Phlebia brevispora]